MNSIGPGICTDCGNFYPHLQRAHVVARHKGGSDEPSNLINVCPNCHHLRDRAERVAWIKQRWEETPPEKRSEAMRRQYAAMSDEAKADRARKISKSKTGKKHPLGHRTGGARDLTPEQLAARSDAVRASYAAWTPERRAEHSRKVREGNARAKGLAPKAI